MDLDKANFIQGIVKKLVILIIYFIILVGRVNVFLVEKIFVKQDDQKVIF